VPQKSDTAAFAVFAE